MKLSKLALAGAIAGLLSAGTAYAQSGLGQPPSVQQTAFEYNSYYAQDYDEQAGSKERGVEGEPDPQARRDCRDSARPPTHQLRQWRRHDSESLLQPGRAMEDCSTASA